jgi:hypothetical protein
MSYCSYDIFLTATPIDENNKPNGSPEVYASWKNHGFKCSDGDSITLQPRRIGNWLQDDDWKPFSFSCPTTDFKQDLGVQAYLPDQKLRIGYQGSCSISNNSPPNNPPNNPPDNNTHLNSSFWIIAGICSAVVLIIIFMIIFKHKK